VILQLTPHHLQQIQTHAASTYPEECCGLLLGTLDPTSKTVAEVRPIANSWTADHDSANDVHLTKTRRYWIAPETLLAAMRDGRDRHLDIIGIYHSHPDHPAEPSECDRQLAWPQYSYLIVAVDQGKATHTLNWSLDDHHQFQPESMVVGEAIAPVAPT
jgi:proteasome lid subunit RPN8/RPN11